MDNHKETQPQQSQTGMPSLFSTLRSTQSAPLKHYIDIAYFIMSDTHTKVQTEKYREAIKIDRQQAANIKRNCHAICPAIQFKPKGRTLSDFDKEAKMGMLDYDNVVGLVLTDALRKVQDSPYAIAAYRTISGMGFRILFRYERPVGCTLTATELHRLAITKAMKYYDELTRLSADRQCLDMTRLCGLSHDEQAYFNWNAPTLPITHEEVQHFYNTQVKPKLDEEKAMENQDAAMGSQGKKETKGGQGKNAAKGGTSQEKGGKPATFDDIIAAVNRHAKTWNCRFEPGSHHRYALRFARFCHNYGADKDSLLTWMNAEMGSQHEGIPGIVEWTYRKTDTFGTWHLYAPGEGYGKNPGMKAIKQWLDSRAEIRFNTMTHKNEIRSYEAKSQFFRNWTQIEDREEATIYTIMDMSGLHVTQRKLHAFINSHFSEDFNPLATYLESLKEWDEEKDPDYIGELCDWFRVKEVPEYYHTHELFKYTFKKWFVAMVVGWIVKKVVNETMLLLVGKGGIFKTTIFEHLLPPELRNYFTNDSSADYKSKDFLEIMSSKALICLDEFATPNGKNLNSFKSCITKKELNVRYPYDRYASLLIHKASLCGTSNNLHIINELESRRYLIWHVLSIKSPLENTINYEGIYSQAVALAKKVMERKERKETDKGWVYWLTKEDMEKQEKHNKLFMENNYIVELILKYYRVPTSEDKSNPNLKFVTDSDNLDRISMNPVLRQSFSNRDIAAIMDNLGFKKQHRRNGNGWWVVEKEGMVINMEAGFGFEPEDKLE